MTHDQVRQLVRRINPIPDPSMLETVDAPVLDLERSMEMQVDDRPAAEVRSVDKWRGPLIGIAAVAVVVIGVSVFINMVEDDVATPAPNAMLLTDEMWLDLIEPGAYYADTDGDEGTSTRGTFVIDGSDWAALGAAGAYKTVNEDYVGFWVVELDTVWTEACAGGNAQPAGSTAQAIAEQFAGAGFIVLEAVAPIQVFGQEGYHLVVEVPAGCDGRDVWQGPTFARTYQREGQVLEYWFLDVEDAPVMVEAANFPDASESDIAELQEVLDTLVITP